MLVGITLMSFMLSMEPVTEQLMLAPAYLVAWTALHEVAHVGAAKMAGRQVVSYRPYPHVSREGFVMGSMEYRGSRNLWVSMAPYMLDAVAFAAADIASDYVGDSEQPWLAAVMACAVVDLTWSYALAMTKSRQSDISPFADKRLPIAIGGAAIIMASWRFTVRMDGM